MEILDQFTSFRKTYMSNFRIAIVLLTIPVIANAADRWIPVGPPTPTSGAPLLNIGHISVNGYGNRVATIRSNIPGFQMDILTEFDCVGRRTRALSSVVTDKTGHLVSAGGAQKGWFNESMSLGLSSVCNEPLPTLKEQG